MKLHHTTPHHTTHSHAQKRVFKLVDESGFRLILALRRKFTTVMGAGIDLIVTNKHPKKRKPRLVNSKRKKAKTTSQVKSSTCRNCGCTFEYVEQPNYVIICPNQDCFFTRIAELKNVPVEQLAAMFQSKQVAAPAPTPAPTTTPAPTPTPAPTTTPTPTPAPTATPAPTPTPAPTATPAPTPTPAPTTTPTPTPAPTATPAPTPTPAPTTTPTPTPAPTTTPTPADGVDSNAATPKTNKGARLRGQLGSEISRAQNIVNTPEGVESRPRTRANMQPNTTST